MAETAAYVAIAAVLAARAPLLASVVGLMVLGILHNVLELRYVLARWAGTFTGPFRLTILVTITIIVFARLAGGPARPVEVVAGFGILAAGMVWGARRRPVLAAAGLPLTAIAAAVALAHQDYYFVAVTYLHNLVPFVFLWDWSAHRLSGRARAAFRAVQVAWLVVIPALLLGGVVPVPTIGSQADAVSFAGPVAGHVATVAPPAWRGPEAARLLAVFAFLQVLHYLFWCWFLPRRGGPQPRLPRVAWAGVAVVVTVFAFGYATAWTGTKLAYTSLASYHAYIEYAVLALVVFRPGKEVEA